MKTVLNDFYGRVILSGIFVVNTDVDSLKVTYQMMDEMLGSFTSGKRDGGVNVEGAKEVIIETPLTKTKKRITLYNVGNNCYALGELTKRYIVIGEFDGRVIVKPRSRTRKRKRN